MSLSLRVGDIVFCLAAAFLFGVFAANMGWSFYVCGVTVGILCVLMVTVAVFWRYRAPCERGIPNTIALIAIIAAVCAGIFYYHAYIYWTAAHTHLPTGKSTAFFGVVTEEPKVAGNFTMIVIGLSQPYAGAMDIFISPNDTQFHYGDELWVKGSVGASNDAGEPPTIFMPNLQVIARHQGSWLEEEMIDLKAEIVQKIAQVLPADQAALLAGILIGTTGTVSATLKAQMEASGTTYIVNMYGYKIAIITAALTATFKDHLPRRVLLWIMLGAVAAFVLVSGGSISAIRAAIMGSFAIIARGTGRVFSARNAVTFAALGMVMLNATLLTDAAFQLSFLSFLGIYYLGPTINNYFHWANSGSGALQWKEHAMLSFATNLAILPVVINTFGAFSLASFISNILIMIPWLAVIALGALLVFLGFASPVLAFVAAQIVAVLLQYELFVIRIFAAITIPMPAVFDSMFVIALYYGILILFAYYYGAPS